MKICFKNENRKEKMKILHLNGTIIIINVKFSLCCWRKFTSNSLHFHSRNELWLFSSILLKIFFLSFDYSSLNCLIVKVLLAFPVERFNGCEWLSFFLRTEILRWSNELYDWINFFIHQCFLNFFSVECNKRQKLN